MIYKIFKIGCLYGVKNNDGQTIVKAEFSFIDAMIRKDFLNIGYDEGFADGIRSEVDDQ